MKKTWVLIQNHKKTSVAILVVLILGGWYYYSKANSATVTTYIARPVALGTIQSTVTGTGQVSSSQEITVNPQVSGSVTGIFVKNGDTVHAGQILATLDSTNAAFSLQSAQISLAKLQSSNPISLASNQNSVVSAQSSLNQSYLSAFNTLTSTYNDMGPVINGLNNLFYGVNSSAYFTDGNLNNQSYGPQAEQYKQTAGVLLDTLKTDFSNFRSIYVAASQSSTSTIISTLNQENTIVQELLQAVRATSIAVSFIINSTAKQNQSTAMTTDQSNIASWISTVTGDSSSINSALSSITNNSNNLNQAVATLNDAQTSSSPLDLKSAQLSLAQAQKTYDEYTIRAPISGVVGNVTLAVGDNASPSSVIATVFTKDYISNITLNEVDAAKIAVGQPVTVTFNALSGVTATGTVTDVDTIGSVSQGVVSYTDIISFASDNPQIKLGMSINAVIVTTEKDNIITVPNSALKTAGNKQYVLIPTAGQTRGNITSVTEQIVQTGLSDNTNTEITGGLNIGDPVVTKTIVGTAATKAAQTNIFSSLTGGRTGGTGAGAGRTGGFGGGTGASRTSTASPAATTGK